MEPWVVLRRVCLSKQVLVSLELGQHLQEDHITSREVGKAGSVIAKSYQNQALDLTGRQNARLAAREAFHPLLERRDPHPECSVALEPIWDDGRAVLDRKVLQNLEGGIKGAASVVVVLGHKPTASFVGWERPEETRRGKLSDLNSIDESTLETWRAIQQRRGSIALPPAPRIEGEIGLPQQLGGFQLLSVRETEVPRLEVIDSARPRVLIRGVLGSHIALEGIRFDIWRKERSSDRD
mmetsp:Transcript_4274/g.9579  ORF Transcript_4274/g.9579 Transcript_4274/m.9579 type:complete len:238 (-) Transcript_4274:884-1597(-)